MMRVNPLVRETARGLGDAGPAQFCYLNCLLVQAAALVLWWPKDSLFRVLSEERSPDAMLALVVAIGATLAYYSVRAGGEELLLPGQRPLREWIAMSPLAPVRVWAGYIGGHLLQAAHLLVLSSPLLAVAYTVYPAGDRALGLALALTVVHSLIYRLAGAAIYLQIGHLGVLSFLALRGVLVVGYVGTAVAAPLASHLLLANRLLSIPAGGAAPVVHDEMGVAASAQALARAALGARWGGEVWPGVTQAAACVALHAVVLAALGAVLYVQIARIRARADLSVSS